MPTLREEGTLQGTLGILLMAQGGQPVDSRSSVASSLALRGFDWRVPKVGKVRAFNVKPRFTNQVLSTWSLQTGGYS